MMSGSRYDCAGILRRASPQHRQLSRRFLSRAACDNSRWQVGDGICPNWRRVWVPASAVERHCQLSADQRAALLLAAMTADEKFALMAGQCDPRGHTGLVAALDNCIRSAFLLEENCMVMSPG